MFFTRQSVLSHNSFNFHIFYLQFLLNFMTNYSPTAFTVLRQGRQCDVPDVPSPTPLYVHMDGRTYGQKISPFYRTSSPTRAAAHKNNSALALCLPVYLAVTHTQTHTQNVVLTFLQGALRPRISHISKTSLVELLVKSRRVILNLSFL